MAAPQKTVYGRILGAAVQAGLASLLAACASKPPPPPAAVVTPDAEPLRTVRAAGFESCFDSQLMPYRAEVDLILATNPNGFVSDVRVLRSTDRCFDGPAREAAQQWRYPPLFVDGVLAPRRGIKAILVFKMTAPDEDTAATP